MKITNIIIQIIIVIGVIIAIVLSIQYKPKIAYVNNLKIIAKYNGMQQLAKEMEEKRAIRQAKIDTLDMELRQEIFNFEENNAKMSSKEKEEAKKLLQKKQADLNRYIQVTEENLNKEELKRSQEIMLPANEVIKEYGEKHKYTIIFGASKNANIVYAKEAIDITDEVLEELNKKSR